MKNINNRISAMFNPFSRNTDENLYQDFKHNIENHEDHATKIVCSNLDFKDFTQWHKKILACFFWVWAVYGMQMCFTAVDLTHLKKRLDIDPNQQIYTESYFVLGNIIGAVFMGFIQLKRGRQAQFKFIFLSYFLGMLLSAFAHDIDQYLFSRVLIGLSMGGQYCLQYCVINELMPKDVRGWAVVTIDSGSGLGVIFALLFNKFLMVPLGFSALASIPVWMITTYCPETPRYLIYRMEGRQANFVIREIHNQIENKEFKKFPDYHDFIKENKHEDDFDEVLQKALQRKSTIKKVIHKIKNEGNRQIIEKTLIHYKVRVILSTCLLLTQYFYLDIIQLSLMYIIYRIIGINEIDKIKDLFIIFYAIGFVGNQFFARLYDTIGRRQVIDNILGLQSIAFGFLQYYGLLEDQQYLYFLFSIFFFIIPAGSGNQLVITETFPTEQRIQMIALIYSVAVFLNEIFNRSTVKIMQNYSQQDFILYSYAIASVIIMIGGIIGTVFGIAAERKNLEELKQILDKQFNYHVEEDLSEKLSHVSSFDSQKDVDDDLDQKAQDSYDFQKFLQIRKFRNTDEQGKQSEQVSGSYQNGGTIQEENESIDEEEIERLIKL